MGPTAADVDLVQGIPRRGQHPHVWPELLGQSLDDVLSRRRAGHSDALCGKVAGNPVLEVEPHHPMELQVLQETEIRAGLRNVSSVQPGCYYSKCAKFQLPRGFKSFKNSDYYRTKQLVWPTAKTGRCNKVI